MDLDNPHGATDTDKAKWVNKSVVSDEGCDGAQSVVGSSVAEIEAGIGRFAFDADVEEWVLCYKHGTETWRLYTGITPVSKSSALPTETGITSETQRTIAEVSLTLEGNIASYPDGSIARTAFLNTFVLDLAHALGVETSRFNVTSMRAGSVVVDFTINPTG